MACHCPSKLRSRRGAALVVVLVLLAIIMMLGAGWMSRIAGQRRQLRQQQFQVQAARLAESGLGRARARLAADAGYSGEVWQIAADTWPAQRNATVAITINGSLKDTESVRITAVATYPAGHAQAVRQRRTANFPDSNERK